MNSRGENKMVVPEAHGVDGGGVEGALPVQAEEAGARVVFWNRVGEHAGVRLVVPSHIRR